MKDDELLQKIRDRYTYLENCWRRARENRQINMRYLDGDPWDPKDRRAREDAERPCLSHDELNQFINRAINNIRMNKRGVKIEPDGKTADSKTAELRQDIVRTSEYISNAEHARVVSFENAIQGGYGFRKVTHDYKGKSFEQEIKTVAIINPDSILFDWDCKTPDWSDANDCFELETLTHDEFKRRFPNAEIQDFANQDKQSYPQWIGEKTVMIAAYWKIEKKDITIYQLATGEIVEELPMGVEAVQERKYEKKQLLRYLINGVEFLQKEPEKHPGEYIPVIPCVGQELWLDEGDGSKRKLRGIIDLAREPQLSLAYLVSQETEEAKMSPRVPFVGGVGQFETDREAWEDSTDIPHAFLQYDMVPDTAGGALPPPQWRQYTPNFPAYEVAKDACRRAIASAIAVTALPTAAQRNNEKSKVALDKIDEMQQVGSYHFFQNYDWSLQLEGRVIDGMIDAIYDTERVMHLRKPDDTYKRVVLNTEKPYPDEQGKPVQYKPSAGDSHHVTISTGPAFTSVQEEYKNLLQQFTGNPQSMPPPGTPAAKIVAKLIKAMNLGAKGDEVAEIFDPTMGQQDIPPQLKMGIQKLQEQIQALNAYAKQKEEEIEELQKKLDAQVVNNEYKLQIEKLKIEKDLAVAEITTKAQQLSERMAFIEDLMKTMQVHKNDVTLQAMDQAHQAALAQTQNNAAPSEPAEGEQ